MLNNKTSAVTLMIMAFFLVLISFSPVFSEGLEEGDPLENFTLKEGLSNKQVNYVNEIKGKVKFTAFVFANTSCGACRKEITTLSDLSKKNKELTTYVVLVDMQGEDVVHAFHKRFNFNVTYLLDPDFSLPPIYGFYFTPSLLLVDSSGKIIYKKGGYNINTDEKLIKDKVAEIIN